MRISTLSLTVLIAMLVAAPQPAAAECLEGKEAVTIVNPAGKVIEICVPAAAVPKVGGPDGGPGASVLPAVLLDAVAIWFDGFQNEGNSEIALTPFQDGFEYAGCVTNSAIGFDRSHGLGNTFFAYLSEPQFTVVADITELEPSLEEPIKAAIEDEALDRGIPIGAPGTPCP